MIGPGIRALCRQPIQSASYNPGTPASHVFGQPAISVRAWHPADTSDRRPRVSFIFRRYPVLATIIFSNFIQIFLKTARASTAGKATGTYTNIEDLISVINATLKRAKHPDIVFSYSRLSSRVSVSVPEGKTCRLKQDSPDLVLGLGEIATRHDITGSYTFPYAVDLSKGRRFVLLYTDLIGPSVEYEDNVDSRVLKTFLIQTLNGINNYVFSKDDKRLMLPQENVTQMSFWLKFNTGELITPGYPITLDLRIE